MISVNIVDNRGIIKYTKGINRFINNGELASNVRNWLDEICQGEYITNIGYITHNHYIKQILIYPSEILFNNDEDAALFQLTWL